MSSSSGYKHPPAEQHFTEDSVKGSITREKIILLENKCHPENDYKKYRDRGNLKHISKVYSFRQPESNNVVLRNFVYLELR